MLAILDGWGVAPASATNAVSVAHTPNMDAWTEKYPATTLVAHNGQVGLPEGQMGNSEVGHMTIGSGRVLYQDLVKISLALEDGSLSANAALRSTMERSETVHLIGLLSDGGVHSHIEHTIGLARIAADAGKRVWLHLITDGRDVSPTSAGEYLVQIEAICDERIGIATISGRYYTMDRDTRWERVEQGYRAIAQAEPMTDQRVIEYVEASYRSEITDEFIEPVAFAGYEGMHEGDAVVLTNFRSDRMREIATVLGDAGFEGFDRPFVPLHIATMTRYDATFSYPVLFPKEAPKNTLAEVISRARLRQFHAAETEKYAHVTFFFNGGIEEPYAKESRC
jgi:2,3-bisphosphoglycerate-independent phosphoglycerate mutase